MSREHVGGRGMRITCVIGPYLPVPAVLGGAIEKMFLDVCEEFAAAGHHVTMISRRYAGLPDEEEHNGVRHLRLPSRDAPSIKLAYRLFDVSYALRVRRALPLSDITITNSVSVPLLLPRSRAGKIYVNVNRYPKGQMGLYRRADRLQAVSKPVARAIVEQTPSVAGLVRTIPNAMSRVFAGAAEAPLFPHRAKNIIFVGRVAREKGIELLIRGFAQIAARHPGWGLRIVGPWAVKAGGDGDDYLSELRALVPPGLTVDFAGPMFDSAQLRREYERSSIFVYPSVAERGETFGVAVIEAMACGCATLVSDLACFADFLDDGANGLVFDHRDASGGSLARALNRLIVDPALRDRLSHAATETSLRYAPPRVAAQFLDDFAVLLSSAAQESSK